MIPLKNLICDWTIQEISRNNSQKMKNLDTLFLRQLEDELQAKEKNWRSQRDEWRNEIDRLQEEIEKQQKLLSINLSKSPQTQAELYMQYEVARLTSENLVSKTNFFLSMI